MFDGEDLGAGDRTKAQMMQNKDWWEQQEAEKQAIKVRRMPSFGGGGAWGRGGHGYR